MSAYKRIKTEIKITSSLEKALDKLVGSGKVIRNGDDFTVTATTVSGWANEPYSTYSSVSFIKTADGYEIKGSDMDLYPGTTASKFVGRVKQEYGYHEICRLYQPQGYVVHRQVDAAGVISVKLTK